MCRVEGVLGVRVRAGCADEFREGGVDAIKRGEVCVAREGKLFQHFDRIAQGMNAERSCMDATPAFCATYFVWQFGGVEYYFLLSRCAFVLLMLVYVSYSCQGCLRAGCRVLLRMSLCPPVYFFFTWSLEITQIFFIPTFFHLSFCLATC